MYADKPENIDEYSAFEVDGITVYIAKEDVTEGVINLSVAGFGPIKHFVVKNY